MMQDWAESLKQTVGGVFGPHGPAVPASATSYAPGDFSIHLFSQLVVILVACRAVGWIGRRFLGQPQVVGEMIAGVVLGPSLLGLLAPHLQGAIFPKESRSVLYAGAQLGVGLYMFLVGVGLRVDRMRSRARSAATVSLAGIVVPFLLAIPLTPLLLRTPGLFAPSVSRASATLFLGACIALTAFPMLARIIKERGLEDSTLGTLSLGAGAFDDACSWCVLAVVLATFGGGPGVAILAIGGGVLWTGAVLLFGPRLLAPLGRAAGPDGEIGSATLAWVLVAFALSAFLMDTVGIHAIFGGFIMGVAMPRGPLATALQRNLEPLTAVLLLPLFFTYSGLNTRLDVVTSGALLLLTLLILAVSILAKGGACYVAARIAGEDNATALGIAALMNSRGLMELIIINIGLQKGIIGPPLFSMLVLMAVATTMMASPLFELVYGRRARGRGELGALAANST